MDAQIAGIEKKFTELASQRKNMDGYLEIGQKLVKKIEYIYSSIGKNTEDDLLILTLDTLRFQIRHFEHECEQLKHMYHLVSNRIYGDYYKLYKYVYEFYKHRFSDILLIDSHDMDVDIFPVYQDLLPMHQYKFTDVEKLHGSVIHVITMLCTNLKNKDLELEELHAKKNKGLHLHGFVSTYTFNTTILREKTTLFLNYLEYICDQHIKYLSRLCNTTCVTLKNVKTDIDFQNLEEKNVMDTIFVDIDRIDDKNIDKVDDADINALKDLAK